MLPYWASCLSPNYASCGCLPMTSRTAVRYIVSSPHGRRGRQRADMGRQDPVTAVPHRIIFTEKGPVTNGGPGLPPTLLESGGIQPIGAVPAVLSGRGPSARPPCRQRNARCRTRTWSMFCPGFSDRRRSAARAP